MHTLIAFGIEAAANVLLIFVFVMLVNFISRINVMKDRHLLTMIIATVIIYPFIWKVTIVIYWFFVITYLLKWGYIAEYIQNKVKWMTRFSKHFCTLCIFLVCTIVLRHGLYTGPNVWNIFS